MTDQQAEREILNTLATMPRLSNATICGVRVRRTLAGFFVGDGKHTVLAEGAARRVLELSKERP